MTSIYYRYPYLLDGEKAELLWCTAEDEDGEIQTASDGVATTPDGHVPSFGDAASANLWASVRGLSFQDEVAPALDLDAVRQWSQSPSGERLDCSLLLDAWNLFGDLANSLPEPAAEFTEANRSLTPVYSKLFYGNNLPAMTPEGERFDPEWRSEEVSALANLMAKGVDLFLAVVRPVGRS